MSIRARLQDAHFLLYRGSIEGALLSGCAAISATSRKRYPDRSAMGDRAAFTKFLGEEMVVVCAGAVVNYNIKVPGADIKYYPEEYMPLQDILYAFVRCTLAHEGGLGSEVRFNTSDKLSFAVNGSSIELGGEVLKRLLSVPEYAPENLSEFPEIAAMSRDEIGRRLFGDRRSKHASYLDTRELRLAQTATGSP